MSKYSTLKKVDIEKSTLPLSISVRYTQAHTNAEENWSYPWSSSPISALRSPEDHACRWDPLRNTRASAASEPSLFLFCRLCRRNHSLLCCRRGKNRQEYSHDSREGKVTILMLAHSLQLVLPRRVSPREKSASSISDDWTIFCRVWIITIAFFWLVAIASHPLSISFAVPLYFSTLQTFFSRG